MKNDDKSNRLEEIEKLKNTLNIVKRKVYEIKKEKDPNLDYSKFSKDYENTTDMIDLLLIVKVFEEEMNKLINLEENAEKKAILTKYRDNGIIHILKRAEKKENSLKFSLANIFVFFIHFIELYALSVISFGILSYTLVVPTWYIFVFSGLTGLLFMLTDIFSRSIRVFAYDPFFSIKLIIFFGLLMILINNFIFEIFESGVLWIILLLILSILHRITSKTIHRIWFRY